MAPTAVPGATKRSRSSVKTPAAEAISSPTIADLQRQVAHEAVSHQSLVAKSVDHKQVLQSLLQQIVPLDFRKIVGLENDNEKLKRSHHVVTVAEEVLILAKRNGWGLCRGTNFLYAYNGAFWQAQKEDDLRQFLQEAAEKMGLDKYEARYFQFVELLFKQFMSTAYLPTPERARDAVKINLANGTFHISLDQQELREFTPADFLTYQLPFEYNPAATAPLFEQFLTRVQPDKDCQQLLAEFIGYVFVSPAKMKLEKTLLLYGSGANGKSVFFEIITAMLGKENVSHHSLQNLTIEPAYCRANLANVLVNYASELGGKLDANVFKQLVSGEPVEARLPYGHPFTMSDYGKLLFNCNELPTEVEHTSAFFRRFIIVPFTQTISPNEQDPRLAAKIITSELSGVFNWVLAGLQRLLQQDGFTDCEVSQQQVEDYKSQSDTVRSFLTDRSYKPTADLTTSRKALYADYRTYCLEEGNHAVNSRNFAKRLENCGIGGTRRGEGHVHFVTLASPRF